jgi:hypothetical protein
VTNLRAVFGIALAGCLATAPDTASAFSAEDVLTYCLATHAEQGFVRDKLRALEWTDVDPEATESVAETLALAMLATRNFATRTSHSPSDWQEEWAREQVRAGRYLERLDENNTVVLIEPNTSSLIMVNWTDGPALRMMCLLAVTEAATKPQTYHPRLMRPNGGEAFYTIAEASDLSTSHINGTSLSVSVQQAVVEAALGIETEIVAVFETMTSYPTSAVRP